MPKRRTDVARLLAIRIANCPSCLPIVTYLFLVVSNRSATVFPTAPLFVKRFEEIDYGFRPHSYWAIRSPLVKILKNVQGTVRRKIIQEHWNAGTVDELLDDLLINTLDDEQREHLSQLHPSFIGGEYLPAYAFDELEIARIELESSTSDVISIRARRCDETNFYSICDEYASDYPLFPALSHGSLTLGELIGLIDYAGEKHSLGLDFTLAKFPPEHYSEDFDRLEDFCTVTSLFYPDLVRHYRNLTEWWYECHKGEGRSREQEC